MGIYDQHNNCIDMQSVQIDDPETFQFASTVTKSSNSTPPPTQLDSAPTADC